MATAGFIVKMADYIDLRETLYPMDTQVETDLLLIEAKANWQYAHDKLLEAEIQLGIAVERLLAAAENCRELKQWF